MISRKNILYFVILSLVISFIIILLGQSGSQAQYWQSLPPYNLLWPLWSPPLSPTDPVTGLPTPIVSNLTKETILPAQPALFWDPAFELPYLLYNIPLAWGGGMIYFNPYFGLNPWPPSYLIDLATGDPLPITLPAGYELLPPTDLLINEVYFGNLLFISQYPTDLLGIPIPITTLLTPGEIWGLPPL